MAYTLYYSVEQEDGLWSVESEQYEGIDSPDPILGSVTTHVVDLPDEDAAHREARRRQVRSYATAR